MTYDKNKILNMLSTASIYDGMEFHEGKNDELLKSLNINFDKDYRYAFGATKLAFIPLDKNNNYVIKIPYTGSYNYESGYQSYTNGVYHPSREDYWPYSAAECEERPWDYCGCEEHRYRIAEEEGFAKYFAKTELIGFINNYPIYIQEKCITFSNSRSEHCHTKEQRLKTFNCCNFYSGICDDWLTDFRLCYGEVELVKFIDFIKTMGWDDDLRTENIGYLNGKPVLIDYSGFLDC